VSASHTPICRADFVREALVAEIATMLNDLGNPPLVDRIFPNGWRNASDEKLGQIYDLCVRTYAVRAARAEDGQ
jgi:hypothetical protein